MFEKKTKKNKERGFVILFAVTLSSIILSIALGVANIALKEASFSTSARSTNNAFLAADTGAECALFHDRLIDSFFPVGGPTGGEARSIVCGSETISVDYDLVDDPDEGNVDTYSFIVNDLGSQGDSCSIIKVEKWRDASPVKVNITSKGYNIGAAGCTSTNPNRVERELIITSATGTAPPVYVPPSVAVEIKCNGADSCNVTSGGFATLTWTSTGALSCTGSSSPSGWSTTNPSSGVSGAQVGPLSVTTTYTFTCFGPGGESDSDSVTATVGAAPSSTTIVGTPSPVMVRTKLTATWSNISNPTGSHTYGFYRAGASDNDRIYGNYISCAGAIAPSGSCSFTIPLGTPLGTYELRLFAPGNKLATSPPIEVIPYEASIAGSPSPVMVRTDLTITWTNPAPSASDTYDFYNVETGSTIYNAYPYLISCTGGVAQTSGTCIFRVPLKTATGGVTVPGTYKLRLYGPPDFLLATSPPIEVIPQNTTITGNFSTVSPGDKLTATWTNIPSPTGSDTYGFWPVGSSDVITNRVYGNYISCAGAIAPAGSCTFTVPLGTPLGTYELRVYGDNFKLATSSPITVGTASPTTIVGSPSPVMVGSPFTVTWSNIQNPSSSHYFLIWDNATNNNTTSAKYITCAGAIAPSGSCSLDITWYTAPGTYELRLYGPSGILATSPIQLLPLSGIISGSPSPVMVRSTLTVNWSNIQNPSSLDYFLIWDNATNNNITSAMYITCAGAPASSGSCSLNIPVTTTPGSYELRLARWYNVLNSTLMGTSPIQVIPLGGATISGSPSPVEAGSNLTVNWSNINNPSSSDYFILWDNATNNNITSAKYITCAGAVPPSSGSCSLNIPVNAPPGSYELRLYASLGFSGILMDTSPPIQVVAP